MILIPLVFLLLSVLMMEGTIWEIFCCFHSILSQLHELLVMVVGRGVVCGDVVCRYCL